MNSIKIDIGALEAMRQSCVKMSEGFSVNRTSCEAAVSEAHDGWEGDSYKAFIKEMRFIHNGVFTEVQDNSQRMASELEDAVFYAGRIKSETVAFEGIMNGGSVSIAPEARMTGNLYVDGDIAALILADIENARNSLSSFSPLVRDALSKAARIQTGIDLSELQTCKSTVMPEISTRLFNVEDQYATCEARLGLLEAVFSGIQSSFTGLRFAQGGNMKAIVNDGKITSLEAAMVLLMTPDHLLSDEEQEVVLRLKELGLTHVGLDVEEGKDIFTAMGLVGDVGTLTFDGVELVLLVNGFTEEANNLNPIFKKIGKGIQGVNIAIGVTDAALTMYNQYYAHPELADSWRNSNMLVEGGVIVVETFAVEIFQEGLVVVGAALGGLFGFGGGPIGAAVGGIVGACAGIAYSLNSDSLKDEHFYREDENGDSKAYWLKDFTREFLAG